jgi:hypothetical protein
LSEAIQSVRTGTYRIGKLLDTVTTVRELMGGIRNVVLMNVYLGLENPGGSGFRVGGVYEPGEGNGEVSLRATWERGGRILSQQGGFQVSEMG